MVPSLLSNSGRRLAIWSWRPSSPFFNVGSIDGLQIFADFLRFMFLGRYMIGVNSFGIAPDLGPGGGRRSAKVKYAQHIDVSRNLHSRICVFLCTDRERKRFSDSALSETAVA
jgi:hypothetical protein